MTSVFSNNSICFSCISTMSFAKPSCLQARMKFGNSVSVTFTFPINAACVGLLNTLQRSLFAARSCESAYVGLAFIWVANYIFRVRVIA